MDGESYKVLHRTTFSEIIEISHYRCRLLCYGITPPREEIIMADLGDILLQTNTVSVDDMDPLEDISWFSGDFDTKDLTRVIDYMENR